MRIITLVNECANDFDTHSWKLEVVTQQSYFSMFIMWISLFRYLLEVSKKVLPH